MAEPTIKTHRRQRGNFKVRAVLLLLQILLPFGLYFAIRIESLVPAGLLAAAFLISMGVLLWLG